MPVQMILMNELATTGGVWLQVATLVGPVVDSAGGFGRFCMIGVLTTPGDSTDAAQIRTILSQFRSPQGLPLAMRYTRDGIDCEVQWPDEWRVAPADALKQSLFDRLGARSAAVEY